MSLGNLEGVDNVKARLKELAGIGLIQSDMRGSPNTLASNGFEKKGSKETPAPEKAPVTEEKPPVTEEKPPATE